MLALHAGPPWTEAAGAGGIAGYLRLLRPHQWTKNAFCLAGALFGPGRILELAAWRRDLVTLAAFCAVSSAVYILNDIQDRNRDRLHPKKQSRPIASGAVGIPAAVCLGLVLASLGAALGCTLGPAVLACLVLYMVNNVLYSRWLKHQPLLDVLSIAVGFCLRMCSGVYALGDLPTTWILLCTFFLAVFLGFAKRRVELAGMQTIDLAGEEDRPNQQRPVLAQYSVQFLDSLLSSAAVMAVLCYALFTTSGKAPSLTVTVPFVFYAVMHYKRMVMVLNSGRSRTAWCSRTAISW